MKTTVEDISGDATAIKHKQSNLPSQEAMWLRSQDSVQNHQPSPQHTRPLNKEVRSAGNIQEQNLFAAELEVGPQVKSAPGTSLSSENQHPVEKDFASHGSPESSTNFNP